MMPTAIRAALVHFTFSPSPSSVPPCVPSSTLVLAGQWLSLHIQIAAAVADVSSKHSSTGAFHFFTSI
jgi:hypothetical protein